MQNAVRPRSPSSRRAWIEIEEWSLDFEADVVALLAEGVDRNRVTPNVTPSVTVALLAEGVDRNNFGVDTTTQILMVALLAEGVDRNASSVMV